MASLQSWQGLNVIQGACLYRHFCVELPLQDSELSQKWLNCHSHYLLALLDSHLSQCLPCRLHYREGLSSIAQQLCLADIATPLVLPGLRDCKLARDWQGAYMLLCPPGICAWLQT